jgi:hypothetical protein
MIAVKLYTRPAVVFTLTTDGDGNITRSYARPKLMAASSPSSQTPGGVHCITAGLNTEPAVLKFITAGFETAVIALVYHQQLSQMTVITGGAHVYQCQFRTDTDRLGYHQLFSQTTVIAVMSYL